MREMSLSQKKFMLAAIYTVNMDITVLPNNNHPEKFLQLDVGMLPATHGMFQIGAALSGQRQWHNRVYSQVGKLLNTLSGI